jgi:ABC-type oligopeptide transport system substrate-binding subunit
MKKAFKVLAIAAIAIAVLPSCKKGDVKAKRLDGDWALVSGTGSTTTTNLDKSTGVSTSYTTSQTYSGATLVSSSTVSGVTTSITTPFIVELTFNKDDNSYESVSTTGSQYTTSFVFYPNNTCDFFDAEFGVQKVETKTVANSTGTFTIIVKLAKLRKTAVS